jgi:predicted dehydrogenase
MSEQKKLRVGVIGCGRISVMHFVSIGSIDEVELVACCDIVKERADEAAKEYGITAYTSYEEMIAKEELDAVHLCLPHYIHSKVAMYAFEKGIHVLTEKPMDIDLESAERAVARAKELGLHFGVIFQCRYNNSARLVKDAVESGKLGKIISARSTLTWLRPDDYYSESDWKGTWDKEGGGVIIDQAIHSLDLANWFINDEPIEVQAHLANRGHSIVEVDDTGEGFIRYKNGTTLSFWAMNNYGCDDPIEIRLYCENGKVVMSYDDAVITYNDGTEERISQENDEIVYEGGKDYWGFRHIRQVKNFYDSVEAGVQPDITGREALKIQKLICAIYHSGRTGETVKF